MKVTLIKIFIMRKHHHKLKLLLLIIILLFSSCFNSDSEKQKHHKTETRVDRLQSPNYDGNNTTEKLLKNDNNENYENVIIRSIDIPKEIISDNNHKKLFEQNNKEKDKETSTNNNKHQAELDNEEKLGEKEKRIIALKTRWQENPSYRIRLAVLGDSLGDGIWGSIYHKLRSNKRIKIYKKVLTGGRLTGLNWLRKVKYFLRKHDIDIAIIVIGGNDGQKLLRRGKPRLSYKTEEWKKVYIQRVTNFMKLLHKKKILTFWIGLPSTRKNVIKDQFNMLNGFYKNSAISFTSVRFLPTRHLTVNKKDEYATYLRDASGKKIRWRANDGVHFTRYGYDKLADYILEKIYEDIPFIKSENL